MTMWRAFELPIKTVSEANEREHWRSRHGRRQKQRTVVRRDAASLKGAFEPEQDLEVKLTRIAPRRLDKGDNLAGSLKAIRDEVAALLGRDDGPDAGIEWRYAQERGPPKTYAVRIEVRAVTLEDRIAEARWKLAQLEEQQRKEAT